VRLAGRKGGDDDGVGLEDGERVLERGQRVGVPDLATDRDAIGLEPLDRSVGAGGLCGTGVRRLRAGLQSRASGTVCARQS